MKLDRRESIAAVFLSEKFTNSFFAFNVSILLTIMENACIGESQNVGLAYEIPFARCCDRGIRGRVVNRIISFYYG
jgi:hypothetical protein